MSIGVVQSFVRILGSPRNAVTADISDPGYLPWFSGYSGSRRLPPPATGCQYPAMVRVPSPGLEYERFRSACGRLRHLDGPIARVGTRATQGWTIRGRVRRLSRRFPRTAPTDVITNPVVDRSILHVTDAISLDRNPCVFPKFRVFRHAKQFARPIQRGTSTLVHRTAHALVFLAIGGLL